MTTATQIQRFSKILKAEAVSADSKIDLYGYEVRDGRIYDDEGGFYPVLYFRCGEEVIAVPEFYIGEDGVSLTGSRGGDYVLVNETLYVEE